MDNTLQSHLMSTTLKRSLHPLLFRFLITGAGCSACLLVLQPRIALGFQKKGPNVLFIAVDDLRTELGCYGVPEIQTPNIDALADSGMLFERAYCQVAVCNPSRVSLLTGLRPDESRVWDLVTRFRETIPDTVTLPQHFKSHGYRTISFGKIFHNPWPDNTSWSEPHSWPSSSSLWSAEARQKLMEWRKERAEEGLPAAKIRRMRAQATEAVNVPDKQHIDGAIAEQAIAEMKKLARQDAPFFLAVGFVRPHLPFVVPRKYWDRYSRDDIPLAPESPVQEGNVRPGGAPVFAMNTMYELRDYLDFANSPRPQEGSLTIDQQRRLRHGYYAAVTFIDALVGRLLTQLTTLKLDQETIVVLWSDHGWKLGEHNSWCKQTNYEVDTRVPLIIRVPEMAGNGTRTSAPVELIDLYPTLCELTGLPVSESLSGTSLVPLLAARSGSVKSAAFSQFRRFDSGRPLMGYAMRTKKYRYVEWQDRRTHEVVATELYDHDSDPSESVNVASLPEHKALLSDLHRQMWQTLPTPPDYEPPPPRRPQLTIRNQAKQSLSLFWLRPDGSPKESGVIPPGKELTTSTTIGHHFELRGSAGFLKKLTVQRQQQVIVIKPGRKRDTPGGEK